jgi:uncharacterized protein
MMTCPKCQNQMQSFTRSGLTVEQCLGCRGVFLDYGELERIIQAEGQYWAQQMQQPTAPPVNPLAPRPPGSHGVVIHSSGHHPHHRGHHHRRSFLGELLDM